MTRKYYVTGILLIAATLIATAVVYPHLSDAVPTHWNSDGQPNDYSPKWQLFVIIPGIMAAIMVLFRFLPWLSPKRFDVDTFQSTYLYIMLSILGMLACIQVLILWTGMGKHVNANRAILVVISWLFAALGNVLGKVRRNFYVGVRTPWSLANERVWYATHRLAAKTFVAAGLVGLVVTAVGLYDWLTIAILASGVLVPVIYSLVYYKQLERAGQLQ
jgi:uncharacterized membrane protein